MKVNTYEQSTRARVEEFLRQKKKCLIGDILCLDQETRCVNWYSLQLILADLQKEGLVSSSRVSSRVVVYEWVGGAV